MSYRTGAERIIAFPTRSFMAERTGGRVRSLLDSGAWEAASTLASEYSPELDELRDLGALRAAWHRMDYEAALAVARQRMEDPWWQAKVDTLERLRAARPPSQMRLGDLLAAVRRSLELGDGEEALARFYRLVEMAAKQRLADRHGLREPYRIEALHDKSLPDHLFKDLQRGVQGDGSLLLGLNMAWRLLSALGDELGPSVERRDALRPLRRLRNNSVYGHGLSAIRPSQARQVLVGLLPLLADQFPDMEKWAARCVFDDPPARKGAPDA